MSLLTQETIPAPALRLRHFGQPAAGALTRPIRLRKASPAAAPAAHSPAPPRAQAPSSIAVGRYVLQLGWREGALVDSAPAQPAPLAGPLPRRVDRARREGPGLLGRQADIRALRQALAERRVVWMSGAAGVGKTALLRWLAEQPTPAMDAERVIYCSAHRQNVTDLRHALLASLYDLRGRQPTEAECRRGLQTARALILLDDVALDHADVNSLLAVAPGCAFVLAATDHRRLGRAVSLGGLRVGEAVRLLEHKLGRPLAAAERPLAQLVCLQLQGNPGRIGQAAALLRAGRASLPELQAQVQGSDVDSALSRCALDGLTLAERNVLAAIAAAEGAPLPRALLARVFGMEASEAALKRCEQLGLVNAEAAGYTLPASLRRFVQQAKWNQDARAGRLVAGLLALAEGSESQPTGPADTGLCLALLAGAATDRQWANVVRLARVVEPALILTGRWGAWREVLQQGLHAARQLGDASAEGWLLHQAGTRALCLGEATAAREALNQAVGLRRGQREHVSAAVTRHNLSLLDRPRQPRHQD